MAAIARILLPAVLVAATASCSKPNANYEVLARKDVKCPAGSHLEYHPWGESGHKAVCLMENGPIIIAENGHVVIEGQYAMGKKVGEWRWLDANGKIVRTERNEDPKQ
jgi:hypothetical protein